QGKGAKDAGELPRVELRQAAERPAVGQGHLRPQIAGSLPLQEVGHRGVAQAEQQLPERVLEVVKRQAVPDGVEDETTELLAVAVRGTGLVSGIGVCHHLRGPPGRNRGVVLPVLLRQAPSFYNLVALTTCRVPTSFRAGGRLRPFQTCPTL